MAAYTEGLSVRSWTTEPLSGSRRSLRIGVLGQSTVPSPGQPQAGASLHEGTALGNRGFVETGKLGLFQTPAHSTVGAGKLGLPPSPSLGLMLSRECL